MEPFDQLLRFFWISPQAFHYGLQVLYIYEACFLLVEHVEDAPEVLDLLLRVHLEDVNYFVFLGFLPLLVWVNPLVIQGCEVDIGGFLFTFDGFGLLLLLRFSIVFLLLTCVTRGGNFVLLLIRANCIRSCFAFLCLILALIDSYLLILLNFLVILVFAFVHLFLFL